MTSTSAQWNNRTFQLRNFNDDFLLLRAADGGSVTTLGRRIFERAFDFVREVIVTEVEICLQLNERFPTTPPDWLATLPTAEIAASTHYKLPVCFTAHEDWEAVIGTTGLPRDEVIDRLLTTDFSVAMFGFLPGFLYLNGLPPVLHVPRKSAPAKYVTAGSIAIGGRYLGFYALDSPGGWHILGQVPISILQIPSLPPVPLQLTDRIQLISVDQATFERIQNDHIDFLAYNQMPH